ncbi:hypothetical protein ESZ50_02550 [Weissella muntiaci]|uniref:Uncharacterized protein n=1 Tax=Weissella muntiaci TaxID=2508881 RepID=A0A6C2CAU7_9LACO|nr:hypothetical protein [Weissella muntiaci]TYC50569.1 hypothetical protein ESZ50_02550 [Weissella muntiaci]
MNDVGTVGNYNFEKNASFNGVTVEKAATQTISIKQSPAFAQGLNNLDKKRNHEQYTERYRTFEYLYTTGLSLKSIANKIGISESTINGERYLGRYKNNH